MLLVISVGFIKGTPDHYSLFQLVMSSSTVAIELTILPLRWKRFFAAFIQSVPKLADEEQFNDMPVLLYP